MILNEDLKKGKSLAALQLRCIVGILRRFNHLDLHMRQSAETEHPLLSIPIMAATTFDNLLLRN